MLTSTIAWEIASFILLAIGFEVWERIRPASRGSRLAHLRLDLLSFAVGVLFVWSSRGAIDALCSQFQFSQLSAGLDHLRSLPVWQQVIIGFLIIDFTVYWIHRAQHRFDLLWRTHSWHHSSEHVNWLSGFRTSFLHSLLYSLPQTFVAIHLLNLGPIEAGIGFAIGIFIQLWDHANADANIGWLRYLFIRPQDHRVHHAADWHRGMNFGFIFSIWDRLFGTYVDPASMPRHYRLGLGVSLSRGVIPRMLVGV